MERISVLQLEYSTECNMKNICKHCYGATGVNEIPTKVSNRVLDIVLSEAKELVKYITITGGEPAVFPEITRKVCEKSRLPMFLMTNGVKFIENLKPFSVLFSLDANDLRPGVDNGLILNNVLRYNCDLACNTVLSSEIDIMETYEKMKSVDSSLKQKGHHLREWKLGFVINKGRALKNQGISPDMDHIFRKLNKFLKIYFQENPFNLAIRGFLYTKFLTDSFLNSIKDFKIDLNRNPCLDCYGRGEILTVNVGGEVQMCTVCREISVPIEDSLVDAVWELLNKKQFSDYSYRDWEDCLKCKYLNICGCGCPSLSMTYGGRWNNRDILQCEIMEKWEKYIIPVLPVKIKDAFLQAIS